MTSEFSNNGDGAKTDATKETPGSLNIDLIMVAAAVANLPLNPLGMSVGELPEWVGMAKDIDEAFTNLKDKYEEQNKNTQTTPTQLPVNTNTKTNPGSAPTIRPKKPFVYLRSDDRKYMNKTVKRGTIQDYRDLGDTTIDRRPARDGSGVDTFIIKRKQGTP